ncbi:MAG: VCBS repeat-containing protein, partial [Ferruginibacter sp.]
MNNDQLPDIAVADMQPETNDRKKLMYTGLNPELYDRGQKISNDQPQLSRNMLQLNNGNRISDSITEPFFSEIGQLSGISETDWSWSVLMADFDNDGWKDMQFTNGISKDLINNDFLSHRNEQDEGGLAEIEKGSPGNLASLKDLDNYGNIKISNYYYHNNGGLNFTDATASAGMAIPSVSQGAAYADLDNDGDLDVVMSNMNQEAFIWKNELRNTVKDSVHNFLSVKLKGSEQNISGIGAKVYLYAGGRTQFLEQNATKGYLSSVIDRLHFGLGNVLKIDSIKIIWPDDKVQWIKQVGINQNTTINYPDAAETELYRESHQAALMTDVAGELNLTFRHEEVSFFDFGDQKMLPQKYSQPGPPLITGDVNKDGLADFFVGGGSYQSGVIFIQNKDGSFQSAKPEQKDKQGEDAGAVFFDADGDKDIDLLVMEGSTEFGNSTTLNVPRLYKNDGNGNFAWDSAAFSPGITTISQAVTVGDYDNDGDEDIFIGGRILANRYPLSPRSYILQNNKGKFTDVTKDVCTALEKPGLVTGAIWTDFDNDKSIDLVICGEWMPVRFFKNTNGKLNEVTAVTGLKNMNGLWRSLTAVDIDKDGDMDFVAGNLGLNNKFHVSPGRPYSLYAGDIDGNGLMDLIPAYYIKNKEGAYDLFPGLDRSQFADEVLAVKKRYPLNKDFASITMKELMEGNGLKNMLDFTCETMASTWIENTGNGHFIAHLLPLSAQFAPINSILATDIDKDGYTDLVLGGNEYQAEVGTGRYDASYGQILTNNGKGGFTSLTPVQSGFIVDGDTKNLVTLTGKNKERLILAAVNNDRLRCFKINAVAGKNK